MSRGTDALFTDIWGSGAKRRGARLGGLGAIACLLCLPSYDLKTNGLGPTRSSYVQEQISTRDCLKLIFVMVIVLGLSACKGQGIASATPENLETLDPNYYDQSWLTGKPCAAPCCMGLKRAFRRAKTRSTGWSNFHLLTEVV